MRRVRVSVIGHVQGVFYRASCARLATRLGIAGSIRNVGHDGVEAVFEGRDEDVEELLAWCHRGPEDARVERVEVSEETPTGERGFRVTR
jgi:acylphosphatase